MTTPTDDLDPRWRPAPPGPPTHTPARPSARSSVLGWRALLHGSRPAKKGTMPAGFVLAILVGALLVAMFVNADATLRKSQAKRNNPTWRTNIARDVADVADALHLTSPRHAIDDAVGRTSSNLTPEEVLARQRAAQARSVRGSPSTTAPSAVPVLKPPTTATPLHMWVGGDSVTETFGTQLVKVSQSTGLFQTTLDFHIGTGLCVPSYFNWPLHLAQDVIPKDDPDVVVIMFGANDGQNIQLPSGQILERFSAEWQVEYAKRVGAVMDLLKSPDNKRIVMWAGPPPMGPTTGTHGMDIISHIDWQEAQTRPWVHYVDTWVYFSDANLQFKHYLPSAAGTIVGLRQRDDIHMSDIGGRRLSWVVIDDLAKFVKLEGEQSTPDPNDLPPPDIKERKVVPLRTPGAIQCPSVGRMADDDDQRDQRRLFFDQVADAYDAAREGYDVGLYDELTRLGALGPTTRVLEVGCGTGQATGDLAARAASVMALEIGPALAAKARRRLAAHDNVEVIEGDALVVDLPAAQFDLVVSATAWHWLEPARGLAWAHERLAPGGWLAVWWHVYTDPDRPDPFGDVISPLLDGGSPGQIPVNLTHARDVDARTEELTALGTFGPVTVWTHRWERHHDADGLALLFSTYSPAYEFDAAGRAGRSELVRRVASEQFGGRVTRPYVTIMYAAPRR